METIHRAENIMEYLKWIIGILVGVFYSVHNFTWLLLVLMIIDTLFGFAVARKRKNLSPSVAADGVLFFVDNYLDGYVSISLLHFVSH